jgi:hypothetical protein
MVLRKHICSGGKGIALAGLLPNEKILDISMAVMVK